MSKSVHIGDVSIPLDSYVISGTALLGTKGAGKTYASKGIAEQLLDHGVPIIVFDPIGRWRFLKIAGEDAKNPKGYKVVVAGGEQPDLPLTPASAAEIVRAAMRENIPLVLDLYDRKLSKADWRRIVQTCFRTILYENKGLRHLFLEETAEFAPQKVMDGETYAEVEKLVRMGGNASVGITLINQRAQEVNKAVLDLCDNLVLMRQRGSHAIEALEKWIDRLDPNSAKTISRAMPTMKAGEAWVFAGSTEAASHVHTGPIRSFHPDRSKPQLTAAAEAARRADPAEFVERVSGQLSKLIDETKANDPSELKRQIAELKRKGGGATREEVKAAEVAGSSRGYANGLQDAQRSAAADRKILKARLHKALDEAFGSAPAMATVSTHPPARDLAPATRKAVVEMAQHAVQRVIRKSHEPPAEGVSSPQQKLLDSLAWLESKGIYPARKETLAAIAGVSPSSGGYFNNLGSLRNQLRLIEYPTPGEVGFTEEGRAAARLVDDSRPVHEHWYEVVSVPERKILEALVERHPEVLEKDALAEIVNVSPTSGGYFNNLGHLRTLGAIDYPKKGSVALTKHVMPE